jgi:hypothetical protein
MVSGENVVLPHSEKGLGMCWWNSSVYNYPVLEFFFI